MEQRDEIDSIGQRFPNPARWARQLIIPEPECEEWEVRDLVGLWEKTDQ